MQRGGYACGVAVLVAALAGCRAAPPPAPVAPAANDIATEYDLIYAIAHGRMSTAPSPFLLATLQQAKLSGGTALDIGGGAGRNSLFLAHHGFQVTDVDLSRIGLDLTRQQASVEHVPVETVAADINAYDFGQERWNLILLIDFPFAYRPLLPKIAAGLKPGGVAVIQDVAVGQPGLESPDQVLHYTFMDRRDLSAPFAGFTILHNEVSEQPTVWGVRALMLRFAARKP